MRRRRVVEEPLTFNTRDVADVLEDHGYVRMAAFVRQCADSQRNVAAVEREWRERYMQLLARLHRYEPPAPPETYGNYKPGPMSDG